MEIFQSLKGSPPNFFKYFATEGMLKNFISKGPPFSAPGASASWTPASQFDPPLGFSGTMEKNT